MKFSELYKLFVDVSGPCSWLLNLRPAQCDWLDRQWRVFERFADEGFASEFAHNPYQRWWELRLCEAFTDAGFELLDPHSGAYRKDVGAPDFRLSVAGRQVWIEAVSPDAGDTEDSVPQLPNLSGEAVSRSDQIRLRCFNGFTQKSKSLRGHASSGRIGGCDAALVAMSCAQFGPARVQDMAAPLLALGDYVIEFDPSYGIAAEGFVKQTIQQLSKSRSAKAMTLFATDEHSHLSGALLYGGNIFGEPGVLSEIYLVENPFARVSVPREFASAFEKFAIRN